MDHVQSEVPWNTRPLWFFYQLSLPCLSSLWSLGSPSSLWLLQFRSSQHFSPEHLRAGDNLHLHIWGKKSGQVEGPAGLTAFFRNSACNALWPVLLCLPGKVRWPKRWFLARCIFPERPALPAPACPPRLLARDGSLASSYFPLHSPCTTVTSELSSRYH